MSDYVWIRDVEAVKETDKAVQVELSGGLEKDKFWVPKSQIGEESEVKEEGDEGDLQVSKFFAVQNEIEYEECEEEA